MAVFPILFVIVASLTLTLTLIAAAVHASSSPDDTKLRDMYLHQPMQPPTTTKYMFQTYSSKLNIPADVYTNIRRYAPEYVHKIYDDEEIRQFLHTHFKPCVLNTFDSLKLGAHKADLARYCLLYMYGGMYLDIKTELIKPVSDIFTNENAIYSVISHFKDHIYQGIIKAPAARRMFFLRLIHFIVQTQNPHEYLDFCKDFYRNIQHDIQKPLHLGLLQGKSNTYYLLNEQCSHDARMCRDGLDRHNLCCFVWDKGYPVIKTRRASYPW